MKRKRNIVELILPHDDMVAIVITTGHCMHNAEEPGRFCVLINQVCNVWMSRDASVPVGMSAGETLPYVPLVITYV